MFEVEVSVVYAVFQVVQAEGVKRAVTTRLPFFNSFKKGKQKCTR
jgi:hypothetical protein